MYWYEWIELRWNKLIIKLNKLELNNNEWNISKIEELNKEIWKILFVNKNEKIEEQILNIFKWFERFKIFIWNEWIIIIHDWNITEEILNIINKKIINKIKEIDYNYINFDSKKIN